MGHPRLDHYERGNGRTDLKQAVGVSLHGGKFLRRDSGRAEGLLLAILTKRDRARKCANFFRKHLWGSIQSISTFAEPLQLLAPSHDLYTPRYPKTQRRVLGYSCQQVASLCFVDWWRWEC